MEEDQDLGLGVEVLQHSSTPQLAGQAEQTHICPRLSV